LFLDLIKRKNLTRFKPNRGEIDKRKRKEGSGMKNEQKKRVAEKRELINHKITTTIINLSQVTRKVKIYFFYRTQGGHYDI